jgi:hypothetical protein
MFGAWGSATPNGELLQLRALDWATNTPFQRYPLYILIIIIIISLSPSPSPSLSLSLSLSLSPPP